MDSTIYCLRLPMLKCNDESFIVLESIYDKDDCQETKHIETIEQVDDR
jgi:hypothetical protein